MNKTISLIFGALMLFFAACEPIENRDVLTNSFDPNDIQLKVTQSTPGGNEISLQMLTPGVTGYWDYLIDTKFTDRVDNVVMPMLGTCPITFYVTTPYLENNDINNVRFVSKSIDVIINQIDHPINEAYYKLVGANLEGKTWVFDGVGGDNRWWWGMVAPYNWQEKWWNAGGECCPPSDVSGRMVFDLNGGANFSYYASPTGTKVAGGWAFNADFTKLTIKGDANILGSYAGSGAAHGNKTYEIKEFTADRLTLYVPDAEWDTGWLWVFKPAV